MRFRRAWTVCATAVIGLAASGCSTAFKDIEVETDTNADLAVASFGSYAWGGAAAMVRDPDNEWAPSDLDIGAEIVFLVNRELRAKGLTEVAQSPDLLVIYAVGVDMMALDIVTEDGEFERFEETPKGGVMIVLVEPDSRRVAWVGHAVAELMEKPDREIGRQRLDYAIKTMFKRYPK